MLFDMLVVGFVSGNLPGETLGQIEILEIVFTYGYDLSAVFLLLYFLLFDWINGGKTLGKEITGVTLSYKLTPKYRFVRSLFKMIGVLLMPFTVLLYVTKGLLLHEFLFSKVTLQAN